MPARRGRERGELSVVGRTVSFADVNHRDKRVYFARPGITISRHADFLLGGCLALVLAAVWILCGVTIALINAFTDAETSRWSEWLLLRGPAIVAILLLVAMPMLGRRVRHADRLGRQLAAGDVVEVPISARSKRLAAIAAQGRTAYFDQAGLLAKAAAMRTQARQLGELAEAADVPIVGGEDYRGRATELAARLRQTADQHEALVDDWIVDTAPHGHGGNDG